MPRPGKVLLRGAMNDTGQQEQVPNWWRVKVVIWLMQVIQRCFKAAIPAEDGYCEHFYGWDYCEHDCCKNNPLTE